MVSVCSSTLALLWADCWGLRTQVRDAAAGLTVRPHLNAVPLLQAGHLMHNRRVQAPGTLRRAHTQLQLADLLLLLLHRPSCCRQGMLSLQATVRSCLSPPTLTREH